MLLVDSWATLTFCQGLAAWFVTLAVPAVLLGGLIGWVIALPIRRAENSLLFLYLLERGLRTGLSAEQTVTSLSRTRDRTLGLGFHLLAAYIEEGLSFARALGRVPRLLPPRVAGLLGIGAEVGDLNRVLPACQRMLSDGVATVAASVNYQIVLLLVINPLMVILLPVVMARSGAVPTDILGAAGVSLPPLLQLFRELSPWLLGFEALAFVGLLIAAAAYAGGPPFLRWLHAGVYPVLDWAHHLLPWRRQRMQRDFSLALAMLLDAGVPEARAVAAAAAATGNRLYEERAKQVRRALEDGASLIDAVGAIDSSGELAWRLRNALRSPNGFGPALEGWHRALDRRAREQEHHSAVLISSALVVANGAVVALAAGAIVQSLVWVQVVAIR